MTEIAPGIDLRTQVLDLMEFEPLVSPDLRLMNPDIFKESGTFGLKNILNTNE